MVTAAGYPPFRPSAWLPGLREGRAGYVRHGTPALVVGSVRGGGKRHERRRYRDIFRPMLRTGTPLAARSPGGLSSPAALWWWSMMARRPYAAGWLAGPDRR